MKSTRTVVYATVRADTTNVGSCTLIFVSFLKYMFNMIAFICEYLFLSNWTAVVFEGCMVLHGQ